MLWRRAVSALHAAKNKLRRKHTYIKIIIPLAIILGFILLYLKKATRNTVTVTVTPKYCVFPINENTENLLGVYRHVHSVLQRVGYKKECGNMSWNVAWYGGDPFSAGYIDGRQLKPHQKVNNFPGTSAITHKLYLATTDSIFIPKAFNLPKNRKKFLEYASKKRDALFVLKRSTHRGVRLKNVSEIANISKEKDPSFVQEYVQNPFLVDGYKFDIGVYVALTSFNPLRVYWYDGDILFRYCEQKYYPLDVNNVNQYVITVPYRPTWNVSALAHAYSTLGFGMRDSFELYARSKSINTTKMWQDVFDAIREIIVKKENIVMNQLKKYPSGDNFFQLVRFDLIVNQDLQVFLMEANLGPNLSSELPQCQLLYEQLLYSLFSLTGVSHVSRRGGGLRERSAARAMVSAHKNVAVWGEECDKCSTNCSSGPICGLCRPCVDNATRSALLRAHSEHLHRADFRRLYPPPMKQNAPTEMMKWSTEINRLQHLWFQGKCDMDATWCT